MQFRKATILSLLAVLPFSILAQTTVSVSYDETYDDKNFDLMRTVCSDGKNGLPGKGFPTAGSLPNFPNVGGIYTVEAYDSPNCGKCYALTYDGVTVNVVAIDHAGAGSANIALAAMSTLTNGMAEHLGRVDATIAEADPKACGL